jgi:hypothetical protein
VRYPYPGGVGVPRLGWPCRLRALSFGRRILLSIQSRRHKSRFLPECLDLFGSRIAYSSVSYFSQKVMSEVSVFRRRRSSSARSTLPLTCTLVVLRIQLSIRKSKTRRVILVENFSEENFDAEGVPPLLAPEGGSGFAEARPTLP